MATIKQNISMDWTTDAGYRAGVAAISGIFDTMGWARTGDSGQLNTGTVTRPSVGASTNYEVRKSNDGKTDIYFKIAYSISNTGSNPYFLLWFGDASDGAGNILSGADTSYVIQYNTATSSSFGTASPDVYPCYFCYETSGGPFVAAFFSSTGQVTGPNPFLICIDRSRDSSGSATSTYFTVIVTQCANIVTLRNQQRSYIFGSVPNTGPASTAVNCAVPTAASLSRNGVVGASAIFPAVPYNDNPMLMAIVANVSPDLAMTGQFDLTIYGATHHYLTLYGGNMSQVGPYTNPNTGFCILWE